MRAVALALLVSTSTWNREHSLTPQRHKVHREDSLPQGNEKVFSVNSVPLWWIHAYESSRACMGPVQDEAKIAAWIEQLGDESLEVREAAMKELARAGKAAEPLLQKARSEERRVGKECRL